MVHYVVVAKELWRALVAIRQMELRAETPDTRCVQQLRLHCGKHPGLQDDDWWRQCVGFVEQMTHKSISGREKEPERSAAPKAPDMHATTSACQITIKLQPAMTGVEPKWEVKIECCEHDQEQATGAQRNL